MNRREPGTAVRDPELRLLAEERGFARRRAMSQALDGSGSENGAIATRVAADPAPGELRSSVRTWPPAATNG